MTFLSEGDSNIKSLFTTLFLVGLVVLCGTSAAEAKRYTQLTEHNITDFVQLATAMTSGQTDDDISDVEAFLQDHLHKKSRFKSTITYVLPGFPPQETALALDKDDYIKNVVEGIHAIRDHTSVVEVTSVRITSGGKQAIVITEGRETGTMAVPVPGEGEQDIPIEGFTSCNQILRLSSKGFIQMYNAVCNTQIQFIGDF